LADPRRGFRSKKARSSKYLEEVDAAGKCRISGNSGGFPSAASTPGERLLLIPAEAAASVGSTARRAGGMAPLARVHLFFPVLTGGTGSPAG